MSDANLYPWLRKQYGPIRSPANIMSFLFDLNLVSSIKFDADVNYPDEDDNINLKLAIQKDKELYNCLYSADDVVAVKHSREAYKTLKAAGAKVEYFEFPGCNHGSWNPAFSQPDFMEWLFNQKK